jgi:hypothetical protein
LGLGSLRAEYVNNTKEREREKREVQTVQTPKSEKGLERENREK